jgi:hypothetical protein
MAMAGKRRAPGRMLTDARSKQACCYSHTIAPGSTNASPDGSRCDSSPARAGLGKDPETYPYPMTWTIAGAMP